MSVKSSKKVISPTHTDMVEQFHILAGQPVNQVLIEPDIRAVRFREHFKIEELIEGLEALSKKDSICAQRTIELLKQAQAKWNEMQPEDLDIDHEAYADSLGDLDYVIQGSALYYGIPHEACFVEIHDKNLTRFPATEEELKATLAKAEKEGVEVTYHFNEEYERWAVIRKDNGKLYKSAMHTPPDLAKVLAPYRPKESV